MTDYLANAHPALAGKLRKIPLASLPTPLLQYSVELSGGAQTVWVKHDDQTSRLYGGNKIRKLEYIFQRAIERGATRVATFGAVGSNHALATAIHARSLGLECTCFLAHQSPTPYIPRTLNRHLSLGTELVRYGGDTNKLEIFRRYLQHRNTWVIPLGGSSWFGAVGFVNAGLEFASQLEAIDRAPPARIYIANGTMGSVAGLAIGLALAQLPIEIHAVRTAPSRFVNPDVLKRRMVKTATMLNRLDPAIPADVWTGTKIVWRDDFYAGGYAVADDATTKAVQIAQQYFGLKIDTTYTGKAMAALLHDLQECHCDGESLFWNTYNSTPAPGNDPEAPPGSILPDEFSRYFD